MPIATPFHSRTATLNESHEWRDWAGFLAPALYEPISHEREYFAIRNSAGLIDISPLFKYDVTGPQAMQLVNRVMTRDISRCSPGRVMYSPWCDEDGKVIDDGTISCFDPTHFRITSAHSNLRWFQDAGADLDTRVVNVTQNLAALALQGPKSRAILKTLTTGVDLDKLAYFRLARGSIKNIPLVITRTGYTGDLGYELWLSPKDAGEIWDHLTAAGQNYAMLPAGMVALDIARIEAGLLLNEVDYISAKQGYIEAQKSSPYELGLGWAVNLESGDFIGRSRLAEEKSRASRWTFIGLHVPWFELERLYAAVGLRPKVAGKRASRTPTPIYKNGRQIGQATSQVFSPLLKKYIAIGTIESEFANPGSQVDLEMTIEYSRQMAQAEIVKTPFFNPPRKRT